MPKLTLSVDGNVISRAKRYAKKQGVSISAMVEEYLSTVSGPAAGESASPPILRSVRGVLKTANLAAYRKRLAAKYK